MCGAALCPCQRLIIRFYPQEFAGANVNRKDMLMRWTEQTSEWTLVYMHGHHLLRALIWSTAAISTAFAQPGFGQPPGPPPSPRAAAPIDLTGYWVSLVTED